MLTAEQSCDIIDSDIKGEVIVVYKVCGVKLYEVGDVVFIKNCSSGALKNQSKYRGKYAVVTYASHISHRYHLSIDNNVWWWYERELEPVEQAIEITEKNGVIIARKGESSGRVLATDDVFKNVATALEKLEETKYPWLRVGVTYYVPNIWKDEPYTAIEYNNTRIDARNKKCGCVFRTKEEATKVAKKMLEVLKDGDN